MVAGFGFSTAFSSEDEEESDSLDEESESSEEDSESFFSFLSSGLPVTGFSSAFSLASGLVSLGFSSAFFGDFLSALTFSGLAFSAELDESEESSEEELLSSLSSSLEETLRFISVLGFSEFNSFFSDWEDSSDEESSLESLSCFLAAFFGEAFLLFWVFNVITCPNNNKIFLGFLIALIDVAMIIVEIYC